MSSIIITGLGAIGIILTISLISKKGQRISTIIMIVFLFVVLIVFGLQQQNSNNVARKMLDIQDIQLEKLQSFAGTYVGDHNKVREILLLLPGNMNIQSIALSKECITINYGLRNESRINRKNFLNYWLNDDHVEKFFINNITTLFILVKNVENVVMILDIAGQFRTLRVSRKDLEAVYHRDLRRYATQLKLWKIEVLNNQVSLALKRKKFFKLYPIHD